MIDHISYAVSNYARSRAFYDAALAPLGYKPVMELGQMTGYGTGRGPQFWISAEGDAGENLGSARGFHLAFRAENRAAVDAFYQAAMAAGARDNGPPGLRPHYHPDYYAAFVFDPDGYRIEAVCHRP